MYMLASVVGCLCEKYVSCVNVYGNSPCMVWYKGSLPVLACHLLAFLLLEGFVRLALHTLCAFVTVLYSF